MRTKRDRAQAGSCSEVVWPRPTYPETHSGWRSGHLRQRRALARAAILSVVAGFAPGSALAHDREQRRSFRLLLSRVEHLFWGQAGNPGAEDDQASPVRASPTCFCKETPPRQVWNPKECPADERGSKLSLQPMRSWSMAQRHPLAGPWCRSVNQLRCEACALSSSRCYLRRQTPRLSLLRSVHRACAYKLSGMRLVNGVPPSG